MPTRSHEPGADAGGSPAKLGGAARGKPSAERKAAPAPADKAPATREGGEKAE